MKNILALSAVFAIFACSVAEAGRVIVENNTPGVYDVYLDGEADNGNFDTVIVSLTPDAGFAFGNIDSGVDGTMPRQPGDSFTYINAFLSAPAAFGGNGFSVLGPVTETTGVEFTAGPLGETIDTVNGPNMKPQGLFLATVQLDEPGTGNANVQLVAGGNVLASLDAPIGIIPEPTTMALAGLSLIGFVASRRRS